LNAECFDKYPKVYIFLGEDYDKVHVTQLYTKRSCDTTVY